MPNSGISGAHCKNCFVVIVDIVLQVHFASFEHEATCKVIQNTKLSQNNTIVLAWVANQSKGFG